MREYDDEEKLKLTKEIKLTKEVKDILRKAKKFHLREGRHISQSKIVCNLIIREYGQE